MASPPAYSRYGTHIERKVEWRRKGGGQNRGMSLKPKTLRENRILLNRSI
jgi:hypothetical protein